MAASDVLLISVILFALGLGFFILFFAVNTTTDEMLKISAINESQDTVDVLIGMQDTTDRLDYLSLGIFAGLVLSLIITGWLVGGHPIFMIIYFIVVVIGVTLSTILSNTWETISQSSVFGNTIASFPITNNILLSLPLYTAIAGFIGIVVLFGKPYFRGEQ